MGQNQCQCTNENNKPSIIPKCALLYQGLLEKFQVPDRNGSEADHSELDKLLPSHANKLPSKYVELLMALMTCNKKYEDMYFSGEMCNYHNRPKQKISRISDLMSTCTNNENLRSNTKFSLLFKFLLQNYPVFCQSIKPIYLPTAGFALCTYYISGIATEVIVDDFIPEQLYDPSLQSWISVYEKGFAKILGNYSYIEELSVGEIFMETTGIPYYLSEEGLGNEQMGRSSQRWHRQEKQTFTNFKDALKCDQILYKSKRFRNDGSVFGYRQNYQINSISFSVKKGKVNLIRFEIPYKQTISIRVTQTNVKFIADSPTATLKNYSDVLLQVFQMNPEDHSSKLNAKSIFGQQHRLNNCIYLNKVFTQIPAGRYVALVQSMETDTNLSLISYCFSKIKLTQVFEQKVCEQFINRFSSNVIPKQEHTYKQIQGIPIKIVKQGNFTFMGFKNNHSERKLILTAPFYFHEFPERKQLRLTNVKDKWIAVTCCTNRKMQESFISNQFFSIQ